RNFRSWPPLRRPLQSCGVYKKTVSGAQGIVLGLCRPENGSVSQGETIPSQAIRASSRARDNRLRSLRRTGAIRKYARHIQFLEIDLPKRSEERRLENIWGAISLATVDKMEHAFAAATGRGPSAIAAITQISFEPGMSIERLRRVIALSHSATVRLVDQLVAEGVGIPHRR